MKIICIVPTIVLVSFDVLRRFLTARRQSLLYCGTPFPITCQRASQNLETMIIVASKVGKWATNLEFYDRGAVERAIFDKPQ